MKKLILLFGVVLTTGSLLAQKPSSDDANFSLEGMINYSGDTGFQWNAPNLRMRYFVNDKIAARAEVTLGSTSSSTNVYELGGDGSGTIDLSSTQWAIGLGAEYHLAGTDKLSPYFGIGFQVGGASNTETWTNSDGTDYDANTNAEVKGSTSNFGIQLGAGVDYYVAENIYMGLELGFGFGSITDNGGTIDINDTSTDIDPSGSGSQMGIGGGSMGFRIGWRF